METRAVIVGTNDIEVSVTIKATVKELNEMVALMENIAISTVPWPMSALYKQIIDVTNQINTIIYNKE